MGLAGTVFMSKKIGVATALETDDVTREMGWLAQLQQQILMFAQDYNFKDYLHILCHLNLVQFSTLELVTIIICSHFSD